MMIFAGGMKKSQASSLKLKDPGRDGQATSNMEIKCCLCGVLMTRNTKDISKGQPTFNNPSPLGKNIGDVCCDSCYTTKVIPKLQASSSKLI
jgi:hypothetical protein